MLNDVNFFVFMRTMTLVMLVTCLSAGCVQLKPQSQWQQQALPLAQAKNSLALVLLGDSLLRKKYEAEWVLALRRKGIKAGPSYAVLDDINTVSGSVLAPITASHQLDTLLVASVSLTKNDPNIATRNLTEYVQHQVNLGYDIFMQQVQSVSVQVSAFSLADEKLLWRAVYQVPVLGQGFEWQTMLPSVVDLLMRAGLTPPPEPTKPPQ